MKKWGFALRMWRCLRAPGAGSATGCLIASYVITLSRYAWGKNRNGFCCVCARKILAYRSTTVVAPSLMIGVGSVIGFRWVKWWHLSATYTAEIGRASCRERVYIWVRGIVV